MQTNNKQREALIKARSAICHFAKHQCQSLSWENSNIQANCGDVLCSWRGLCEAKTAINAALAAPVKNCEVGTPEEQMKRQHDTMCNTTKACPDSDWSCRKCFAVWAQMPYMEQKGESNESK